MSWHQPAHSPELMPIEHIWQDIREKHFPNHVYESIAGVEDTLCVGLLALCSNLELLRSLTFFPHLKDTLINRKLVSLVTLSWYEQS